MTNTGDFRRYTYAQDTTYAVKAFNMQRISHAPELQPDTGERLKVRENKKVKSKAQLEKEQKRAFFKALQIAVVAVVSLAMLSMVIYTFAQKNELTREISQMQVEISNAESENVSLESELDSLVSMSMIDKYAVEELGMTKVQSNQIQYIDVQQYKQKRQKAIKKQSPASYAEQLESSVNGGNKN